MHLSATTKSFLLANSSQPSPPINIQIDNLRVVYQVMDTPFSGQEYLNPAWDILCKVLQVHLLSPVAITV